MTDNWFDIESQYSFASDVGLLLIYLIFFVFYFFLLLLTPEFEEK